MKELLRNSKVRIALVIIVAAVLVFSFLKTYVPSLGFSPWNETLNSISTFGNENDAENKPLSVHFIDVGQGDCILIKTESGNALIDTGKSTDEDIVRRYLLSHNVSEIDYMFLTHPHADHIGCAAAVVGRFDVKRIVMPEIPENLIPLEDYYTYLVKNINKKNIPVFSAKAGDIYNLGDCVFKVLAPVENNDELNNMSAVIRLDYGETSFLFMGDAEADEEISILQSKSDVNCDVIKLGHHGSMKSSTERFINEVSPYVAVISVGIDNSYGHPNKYVLEMLESKRIPYLRTDLNSDIIIGSDGEKLYCYHKKGEVH